MTPAATFQVLENRTLLSAAISGSTLQVTGSDDADVIEITRAGDATSVSINGDTSEFSSSAFKTIRVSAGDGADSVTIAEGVAAPARINGEAGNDSLTGGDGNDTLIAGLGDDVVDGGGGWNTLDYRERTEALTIDMDFSITGPDGEADRYLGNIEVIRTGSGDDTIAVNSNGPDGVQSIDAGAGNDTVDFWRHYDGATVTGGAGNDDILIGNHGRRAVYYGGAGNDNLRTYRSSNTGRDFHGGAGIDTVDYSPFNTGFLTLTIDNKGGDGVQEGSMYEPRDNVRTDVEVVIGTSLDDSMAGSNRNETLIGGLGNDWINGRGGSDSLDGGEGDDTIIGGAGDDSLAGDAGADSLDGGVGKNVVDSDNEDKVATTSKGSQSSLTKVAAVTPAQDGAPFASISNGLLRIDGTSGNDTIFMRKVGGGVEIQFNGEIEAFADSEFKKIQVRGADGKDSIDLRNMGVSTVIYGGNGDDQIYGSAGSDRIVAGEGADWVSAGAGNDSVYGNGGNDRIFGGDGVDQLYGDAGRDYLRSNGGRDQIFVSVLYDNYRGNSGDVVRKVADVL